MSHIHWPGMVDATVTYLGQDLLITVDEVVGDPIGTLRIKAASHVGLGITLPNSTKTSVTWTAVPGTNPVLEVRQDGYFDQDYIEIRQADGSPLGGVIAEDQTVAFNRPSLVDPPTAADMWQYQYNGNRVTYANEFACLRVRGISEDQTPVRFMSHATRDNTAHPILQVSLSNASTHKFQVLANGDIQAANGASMLPSTPIAVTYAGTVGNAATITDGAAGSGAPYPVTSTYTASDNRVWLDGSLANTGGVAIPAQTTLFTIDAAHRPTSWVQFPGRTSTNLAVRITVKGATGAVCVDQSFAAGATVALDGANYRKV